MTHIRKAALEDAGAISDLLAQLGYCATPAFLKRKLADLLGSSNDLILIAELRRIVVGVISLHILNLFHTEGRLGRITSIVVDRAHRRAGVGRLLFQAAEQYFQASGCVRAEVTSGDHRSDAHVFYQAIGFAPDERRFVKRYTHGAQPTSLGVQSPTSGVDE
jgi:GNAT superfamily N-acetyltransferase